MRSSASGRAEPLTPGERHTRVTESAGWSVLVARWAECAWWEGGALVSRGALHVAYAMLHARAHSHAHLRHALGALLAADIDL